MNYLNHNKRIVELCNGEFGKSQAGTLFYPFQYIPSVIEDTFACVCFEVVSTYSPTNNTLSNLSVYFWPMCHMDMAIMKGEFGLRYDSIAQEIITDFAFHNTLGIGRTQITYNKDYTITQEIRGRELRFSTYDISPEAYNRHAQSFVW